MKIRKAVIPAAGLGTRMLPASKAVPKEMYPIVDKPAIQYIVEEAVRSGIEDILIITSRGKTAIEDHFDRAPELEQRLEASGKQSELSAVLDSAALADIVTLRQKEIKGLGHAVYCAKSFVGDEPFAVLYGDDVIMDEGYPVTRQLIDVYNQYGLGVAGIKEVPRKSISRYSSLKTEPLKDNLYRITDMIEKPAPGMEFSLYSILGRVVLPPRIFDILQTTPRGANNEIQLTDAMRILCLEEGMTGVDYIGKRYDMGSKLGVLEAIVETGLKHPEVAEGFREYLKRLSAGLFGDSGKC